MPLTPGSRLGPYEIRAPLGAGGMGVVYVAHDTRLDRDVAVKLLPDIATVDPESRARLLHEARTAAALNHAHICTVHDVGDVDGVTFIAMELVEGDPLQQIIRRGRFSAERTCRIGRQLADALEYAHAHHVVHRDFKSANVILTPDGRAKILDFGIAMRSAAATDHTHALTLQEPASRLAGTVGYMAPEVLQGSSATVRSDIWALGVVLYEMLAGRAPFEGTSDSALVAAILRDPPPPLPSGTPPGLARIVERCLAKEPLDRPGHAGEVALALEIAEPRVSSQEFMSDAPSFVSKRSRRTIALAAVAVVAIGTAVYLAIARRSAATAPVLRFSNPTQVTTSVGVEDFPAWSPDGRTLAYAADPSGNPDGPTWDIWVVQPGAGAPIDRTADYHGRDLMPSWSPDGSQIAFWSDRDGGGCYVMPARAGAARRIAAASPLDPNPPQWSSDGTEIGCVNGDITTVRLDVVSMQTGQVVRQIDLPGKDRRTFVTASPNGRAIALVESSGGLSSDVNRLWILDLPSKKGVPLTDGRTRVMSPTWAPDGRTLYYVANSGATMDLWGQRIAGGAPTGAAHAVTAGLGIRTAALSADGRRLAYSQGRKVANVWRIPIRLDRPATWSDAVQVTSDQAFIECVDVNRAGTELVMSSDRAGSIDLWTLPISGGEMHQLTTDPSAEWCPSWSPDGSTVAFYAYRTGNREVWTVPAAGGAWRRITDNPGVDMQPVWSADGKELLFLSQRDGWIGSWAMPAAGGAGRRITNAFVARWSPVDRRIAYTEGPRIFVAADDGLGAKVQVSDASSNGRPSWTLDGSEILFCGAPAHPGIYGVRADGTGHERQLMDVSGRRGSLGDSGTPTDGTFVYFTWNEDLGDLWVMSAEGSR